MESSEIPSPLQAPTPVNPAPSPEPAPVSPSHLPNSTTTDLVVPAWALRARAIFRKGLILCAGATGFGYIAVIAGIALGLRKGAFLFVVIPFAGIVLFSVLQVLLLAAGFVQYSLGQLLKYTLIGAACMSAIVGHAHWSLVVIGVLGLCWIAVTIFWAASEADIRQK